MMASIILHDVPLFTQGSQDMACGWYSVLMMRAALEEDFLVLWWSGETPNPPLPFNRKCGPGGRGIVEGDAEDALRGRVHPWKPAKNEKNATECIEEITQAISEGCPAMLRLPKSAAFPEGHFVVVKGVLEKQGVHPAQFLVNDPLAGETTMLADPSLFWTIRSFDGGILLAKEKTWLRRRSGGRDGGLPHVLR